MSEPQPQTTTFETVLDAELTAVAERRRGLWTANGNKSEPPPDRPHPPLQDRCCPTHEPPKDTPLDRARKQASDQGLVGLAFSGGGIRSGSVCLGFLQGLAKLRMLRVFDYLSTVSGGGYAGAWFAAWVKREGNLENVEKQLDPSRVSQASATRYEGPEPIGVHGNPIFDQEPEPVHHVRAYSNYLTPWPGLFSTDTWTLLAIYLRNTLVTLTITLAFLMTLVIFARLVVLGYSQPQPTLVVWQSVLWGLALVSAAIAFVMILRNRARVSVAARPSVAAPLPQLTPGAGSGASGGPVPAALTSASGAESSESSGRDVLRGIVLPLLITATIGVWAFPDLAEGVQKGVKESGVKGTVENVVGNSTGIKEFWSFLTTRGMVRDALVAFLGVGLIGGIAGVVDWVVARRTLRQAWDTAKSCFVFGFFLGLLAAAVLRLVAPLVGSAENSPLLATIGPPLLLCAFVLAGFLEQALFSASQAPYEREWRSRLAAYLLMVAAAWAGFFAVVLYLPAAFASVGKKAPEYVTPAVVGAWALAVVRGVFAARDPRPSGAGGPGAFGQVAATVAPVLFLIGLIAGLSVLLGLLLDNRDLTYSTTLHWTIGAVKPGESSGYLLILLVVFAGCVSVAGVLSLLADVNVFSLHSLYGNRLIRCFLAASRRKPQDDGARRSAAPIGVNAPYRRENLFTGFDPGDDFPLSDLSTGYDGPYPLFNTALNLVGGSDLATRDRKAAAFVLTPHYCGSDPTGYAQTPKDKGHADNVTLGRAMTISGAAADPNMSLVNSTAQVALLTVLNARLGWWIQNPRNPRKRREPWTGGSPRSGVLGSLFREFLGLTNADGEYVHLSDGGHFDNSGVYELVRRRCRFVVAVDAAEDRNDASENLANMIRLVRQDFGIRIEIDPTPLKKGADELSRWHVAMGTIRYDDVDPDGLAGTFVFIRSSLTGDEPADLKQYAAANPKFPHHPTVPDQFFDETKFESYRVLGEHLAASVFGDAAADFRVEGLKAGNHTIETRRLFATVRNRWFPPPPDFNRSYLEAAKTCDTLMRDLSAGVGATDIVGGMYPELVALGHTADGQHRELLMVNRILNAMEMAWMGIQLEGYYAHPMHRGWMGAFRRWAATPAFQTYWPLLRGEYSKEFVRFCERVLNLPAVSVVVERSPDATDTNWDNDAKELSKEFAKEWAETLIPLNDYEIRRDEDAREKLPLGTDPRCGYVPFPVSLKAAISREVKEAKRLGQPPMVWYLRIAKSRAEILSPNDLEELKKERAKRGAGRRTDVVSDFTIGVIAAFPAYTSEPGKDEDAPAENDPRRLGCYEAIFWVRGPYRSLQVGRQAMDFKVDWNGTAIPLHALLRLELGKRLGGKPTDVMRVFTRYPLLGDTAADRLQQALWLNFFHDYEFRRTKPTRGERFMTLQYLVSGAQIDYLKTRLEADYPIRKKFVRRFPPQAKRGPIHATTGPAELPSASHTNDGSAPSGASEIAPFPVPCEDPIMAAADVFSTPKMLNATLPLKQDAESQAKLQAFATEFKDKWSPQVWDVLKKSNMVHFARFTVIDNKYLQILTEYDGDFITYSKFFAQELPDFFRTLFSLVDPADPDFPQGAADLSLIFAYIKKKDLPNLGGVGFSAVGPLLIKEVKQKLGITD